MRIAFLLSEFPCLSETFILNQVRGLLSLGHEVDIFPDGSTPPHLHALEEAESEAIMARVRPSPSMPGNLMARALKALPLAAKSAFTHPRATLGALNVAKRGALAASLRLLYRQAPLLTAPARYDIVHAHFGNNGILAEIFQQHGLVQGPLVVTFYGYDVRRMPRGWGRVSYNSMSARARRILVLSDAMKQELAAKGLPQDKLLVHHLGIDCARFNFRPRLLAAAEPPRLLTIARLVPKKGISDALRAVAIAARDHPAITYDIIGDGPMRGELEALRTQLGLDDRVHFHGWQKPADVVAALDRAHLFLCPSITAADGDQEGTPTVLMEAQAMGLPVVATQHAGIPEVIAHGETGLLVPERAPEALGAALLELLATPNRWPAMARAGRARIEAEFNSGVQSRKLVELYQGLSNP